MNTRRSGSVTRSPKNLAGKSTKKTQRYFCEECKKYFTIRKDKRLRYSRSFRQEAVKRYVEDITSFRNVARRMGVSRTTVLKWVSEAGESCKDMVETNRELKPTWSGILGIDGKPIAIAGRKETTLLGADVRSRDIVHLVETPAEDTRGFEDFLTEIRDKIGYPVVGIVSDLGKGGVLIKLITRLFPGVPHQLCVIHFQRYIGFLVPQSARSQYFAQNTLLKEIINEILFAPSLDESDRRLAHLKSISSSFEVHYQKAAIRSLVRHYLLLTNHFRFPHLPRDNNVAEGIVKQLNRKLRAAEGYANNRSAYNHLKLWAICYRFKPFSDSRTKGNNGKSPLQLTGVDTSGIDWLDFSKKDPKKLS